MTRIEECLRYLQFHLLLMVSVVAIGYRVVDWGQLEVPMVEVLELTDELTVASDSCYCFIADYLGQLLCFDCHYWHCLFSLQLVVDLTAAF